MPADGSVLARFAGGAAWPLRGARVLLRTRRLWSLVAIPALINTLLLVGALAVVVRWTPALLGRLWPLPPGAPVGEAVLWWALAVLLIGSLAILAAIATYLASGLIATPFLDQLSDHVERMQRGAPPAETTWTVFFVDVAWSVAHTTAALVLWAAIMGALLVVGLVPVVGPPVELALSLAASAWLVAREMMDGPMSRRGMTFAHKLRVVLANGATTLGFGLVVAALLWIPLLNFLVLPIAVVGGTSMFLDLEDRGLVPPARS